jgi:CRISPR system Cascade subunit CasA
VSLLSEKLLPVRRRDGTRFWIPPCQIADPEIVAFAADRADFNGALAQFVVGLLQTTTPMDDPDTWRELFNSPPDPATLAAWFASVESVFAFDGDGARFMQDLSLGTDEGADCDIGALLIESPGENALKNNSDHFVKRGQVSGLCPYCAAMALLTLQINAPSGGSGHRTSLRGGGPLTTLVLCQPPRSLWHDLWLNVRERSTFLASQGDPEKTMPHFTFPWLADIHAIQRDGGETFPAQVHPHHVFWAMPRRIRLDMMNTRPGECDVCGRFAEQLIQNYRTRNYGLNYKGSWNHPFSPYYYDSKNENGWLPFHPQPGGFGYRHWLPWVMGQSADKRRPAQTVGYFREHRFRSVKGQLRLWAFGYDVENMKARCWYESTLPLYGLADCDPDAQKCVESEVGIWLAGAELALGFLRSAVKQAWFGTNASGDFSAIDAAFWSMTEAMFYEQLKDLIDLAREDKADDIPLPMREGWHRHLKQACLRLFDGEFVGTGPLEYQNPRRAAIAHRALVSNLNGKKMRKALALSLDATPKAGKKKPETVGRQP